MNASSSMECMARLEYSVVFPYMVWIKKSMPRVGEIVVGLVGSVNRSIESPNIFSSM